MFDNLGITPESKRSGTLFNTPSESGWQECPTCDGTGKEVMFYDASGANTTVCSTCNGKRIISKKTGKPPQ